jgi:hypothetical protein
MAIRLQDRTKVVIKHRYKVVIIHQMAVRLQNRTEAVILLQLADEKVLQTRTKRKLMALKLQLVYLMCRPYKIKMVMTFTAVNFSPLTCVLSILTLYSVVFKILLKYIFLSAEKESSYKQSFLLVKTTRKKNYLMLVKTFSSILYKKSCNVNTPQHTVISAKNHTSYYC